MTLPARTLQPALWVLTLAAAGAWAQTTPADAAQAAASGAPQAPATDTPRPPPASARASVPGDSAMPDQDCYRAALRSTRRASAATAPPRDRDAYVCDLAVQMARDGGSSVALAAALGNRALVLAGEGRLEPALKDLQEAAQQTPDDPAVHGNRGNLLLRMNQPAEALAAHSRAVDLAPRDPRGYYNRAFSYRALGEPVRADQDVAAARSLLERGPSPRPQPRRPRQGPRPQQGAVPGGEDGQRFRGSGTAGTVAVPGP